MRISVPNLFFKFVIQEPVEIQVGPVTSHGNLEQRGGRFSQEIPFIMFPSYLL